MTSIEELEKQNKELKNKVNMKESVEKILKEQSELKAKLGYSNKHVDKFNLEQPTSKIGKFIRFLAAGEKNRQEWEAKQPKKEVKSISWESLGVK